MPAQGLVTSVPPGVTVIRRKDEPSVAFKYHEGCSVVPPAFRVSTPVVSCPVFGRTLTRGRCVGGGAERCCSLSSLGPATAATSVCDSICDIPMPGSAALAGAHGWRDAGFAGCPFATTCLLSSPSSPCCPRQAVEMPGSRFPLPASI